MENSATLSQQKRKLARLKDALTNQIQKYHSQDAEHKAENQLLTEDYRRISPKMPSPHSHSTCVLGTSGTQEYRGLYHFVYLVVVHVL